MQNKITKSCNEQCNHENFCQFFGMKTDQGFLRAHKQCNNAGCHSGEQRVRLDVTRLQLSLHKYQHMGSACQNRSVDVYNDRILWTNRTSVWISATEIHRCRNRSRGCRLQGGNRCIVTQLEMNVLN